MNEIDVPPLKPDQQAYLERLTKGAVLNAKIEAAHVLADEIKRRKELARMLAKFVAHYAEWMDNYSDDAGCTVYSRHTFGDLREARKLIGET